MKVPWLPKETIADAAAHIIKTYEAKANRCVQPPIPVEAVIERGLGLKLGFTDLRKQLKLNDVLGATYIKEGLICVDRSLAKNQNEGRLCFTFAHEAGHWVLHRKLIDRAHRSDGTGAFIRLRHNKLESTSRNKIGCFFSNKSISNGYGSVSPTRPQHYEESFILCRMKDAKKPIEWQADYFASCMLMPEDALRDAFCKCYGPGLLLLYNVKSAFCGPICLDPCAQNWPLIAAVVKKAGGFSNVSKQAMIIRLQDLGLVKNQTRAQLTWEEGIALV